MRRIIYALLLIDVACLLAGIYGMLYNQIVYTISPEFFTRLQFLDSAVENDLPERVRVASWGFLNLWLKGIIIGIVVVPFGSIFKETRLFLIKTLTAFSLVALITWIVSFAGLTLSYFIIDVNDPMNQHLIAGNFDANIAFARVQIMNNFSLYGSFVGVFYAVLYLLFTRFSIKKKLYLIFSKRDSLFRIFFFLSILRILCYLFFFYYAANYIIYLRQNRNSPYIRFSDIVTFIIFELAIIALLYLDISIMKRIRKDTKPIRNYILITSILSIAVFIYKCVEYILSLIRIRYLMGSTRSSIWEYYQFGIWQIVFLLIFVTGLLFLFIIVKYKKNLIKKSSSLAEPVLLDYVDNHSETINNG